MVGIPRLGMRQFGILSTSFARIHGGVTASELVSAVDGAVASARKLTALTPGGELMFGLVF
jgi:hypothetical protein